MENSKNKQEKEISLTYQDVKSLFENGNLLTTQPYNIVPSKTFIRKGNSLLMLQNSAKRVAWHTIGTFISK